MNKPTQSLIILACLVLAVLGAGVAWFSRDWHEDAPATQDPDYAAFVERFGSDEPAIRGELNELVCSASAMLDSADRSKANALNRECLDAKMLLEIAHVRRFIAGRGEGMAYHFVNTEHRDRLRAIAGDRPTPERVVALRKSLAAIALELATITEPPDWTLKVEDGTPPPMPFLDLLRDAHQILAGDLPALRMYPRVPAFSSSDAMLLDCLDRFFNDPKVRAAFPPAKYAKLYRDGRIPPIPFMLAEYQTQIAEAVRAEQQILLPGDNPDPESVQAVTEVYAPLERFLSAIVSVDK
jgi:hypothetical protein